MSVCRKNAVIPKHGQASLYSHVIFQFLFMVQSVQIFNFLPCKLFIIVGCVGKFYKFSWRDSCTPTPLVFAGLSQYFFVNFFPTLK